MANKQHFIVYTKYRTRNFEWINSSQKKSKANEIENTARDALKFKFFLKNCAKIFKNFIDSTFAYERKKVEIAAPKSNRLNSNTEKSNKHMNKLLLKCIGLCSVLFLFVAATHAQTAGIQIKVTKDGKGESGVDVKFYRLAGESDETGSLAYSDTTDENGQILRSDLQGGRYRISFSKTIQDATYTADPIEEVLIAGGTSPYHNVALVLQKVGGRDTVIIRPRTRPPAISQLENVRAVSGDKLVNSAQQGLGNIIATTAGVGSNGSIKATRADGSGTFVDGQRVIGSGAPSVLGVDQISVNIGGIRAMYGDLTGGAFEYQTRGATLKTRSAILLQNSHFLDPFGAAIAEGFISGPIIKGRVKNKEGKTDEYVKLGYMLNGQVARFQDNSPTRNGVYVVKEDVLKRLEENPLILTPSGFVNAASYITENDLERFNSRRNSPAYSINTQGKLEFRPNRNIEMQLYGYYFYNTGLAASNQIMNYKNNPRFDNHTIRSYFRFQQNFNVAKGSNIKQAFYFVRAEYQNAWSLSRDAQHMNNIFDYGYIGTFKNYQSEFFQYENNDPDQDPNKRPKAFVDQNGDTVYLRNYWKLVGYSDTAVRFTASNLNPLRANYTRSIYNLFNSRGATVRSEDQILASQGLLNGFSPASVYNLWAAPGAVTANYAKSQTERYSVWAIGEMKYQRKATDGVDKPVHSIQAGLNYEQTISRAYTVAANGLWRLMRQLVNRHISDNIDDPGNGAFPNAILSYDEQGVFMDTVRFKKLVKYNEQSTFDRNFRNKLIAQGATDVYGRKINQESFLNVNSYQPSDFSMDMFSADELLNNGVGDLGTGFINYFGYDYLGKKVKGRPNIDEFLLNPSRRTIGAFQPVYIAAWLEDQFQFKDLVFRIGLRMERYDANQPVLKDPYSFYPVRTVAEVKSLPGVGNIIHPSNMGDDFKVYVNDIKAPDKIVGYRDGDRWYNADGSEQKSPEFLANQTKNGRIQPYLVDGNSEVLSSESLRDFAPAINILPRIWFSFPLQKNKKSFYVSYDVLAQRPNSGASFLTIDELYYIKNRQGNLISNGDLKPRTKTDYEVGYKHSIKDYMGFELIAAYSEFRNDFGQYLINQAYPITYITFRNIDFATATSFRANFIAEGLANSRGAKKGQGPLSLSISYQYLVADGTGANINSQAALINSGQGNLRTVIPLGDLDIRHSLKTSITMAWGGGKNLAGKNMYFGPKIGKTEIFKYTSFNLIGTSYSGAPYTPANQPIQIGTVDRQQILGAPFGARLPWNVNFDLNITKGFQINRNLKSPLIASVFLNINNLLNTANQLGAYRFTGLANDDGFLNSPQGQQTAANQISAESFVALYRTFLNSNAPWSGPRTIRLGLRLNFN